MQGPTRYASQSAALTALNNAIQNLGAMAAFSSLTPTQRSNLSFFISNWRAEGNVSANPGPTLSVSAIGQSASTVITLFNNGRAPMNVVANNGVRLSGAGAAQFTLTPIGNGCLAQTLAANGGSCQVRVTYQPTAAGNHVASLTFEHNGEPQATTGLAITGSLASSPTPAPSPAPTPAPSPAPSSGGGGALPLALWAALLPAALLARRRRV
jgi:hypothetical protein